MYDRILENDFCKTTRIYRIIPKKYFDDLFDSQKNTLVRPKLWPDPFENLALNSKLDIQGEKGRFGFLDDIYAQCWTLNQASDAMWQIYSHGTDRKDGIRIRSTLGKLLTSLSASAECPELECFIGKVRYLTDKKLRNFAENHFSNGLGSDGKKIIETLLVKRTAFKHENEARLIFRSSKTTSANDNLYRYNFDPHQWIEQIMLSPFLEKDKAETLKKEIKESFGWTGELKRSKLYDRPKGYTFRVKP
jgi:hypothetical protein